jgi:5'-nucleotidase / UDP-sugar diphosphatase
VAGSNFTPAAISNELPAGRKTVVLELTGAQLLDVMEHAVSGLPAAANSFLQVSGLRLDVIAAQPVGTRVVKLTVGGQALDFAKTYKVATTVDLAAGAEGFQHFAAAKRIGDAQQLLLEIVTAALQDRGVKDMKVLGRIDIVN